jgi:hypothetical protein
LANQLFGVLAEGGMEKVKAIASRQFEQQRAEG